MDNPEPKFYAVCQFCFASNKSAVIEFNFKEQAVYYICPECKKHNKMTIKSMVPQPLPKARLTR